MPKPQITDQPNRHVSDQGTGVPRVSRVLFTMLPIVGIITLAFLAGMITAIKQAPPYRSVRDALIAFYSLSAQEDMMGKQWPGHLWYPTSHTAGGVLRAEEDRIQGDYTLLTSSNSCTATLIDHSGAVVHRWDAPFRRTFPKSKHVPAWVTDQYIIMRRAIAYPNGDLLALYETIANTPSGCGLAKFDVAGQLIWAFNEHTHHDFSIGNDGRIYVLVHELSRMDEAEDKLHIQPGLPLIEDFVVILDSNGQECSRFSLLDAMLESPYCRPMLTHVDLYGDVTHNNTVHFIDQEFASHYPEISPGDLMVCLRNLNLVAVVNPESAAIVWATNGPWEHPHDPDPLPNGNIMIFDNFTAHGAKHGSAVLEFDPRSRDVRWTYSGDDQHPFRSDTRGCQQKLAEGNVLITEGDGGRILEVDRLGQVVWEYVHPLRGGEDNQLLPLVCGALRYTAEELPFIQKQPQAAKVIATANDDDHSTP